jgi:hypothetical protein
MLSEDESEGPLDGHYLIRGGYFISRKKTIWNTLLVLFLLIISNTIIWLASTTSKTRSEEGHKAISTNLAKEPLTPFSRNMFDCACGEIKNLTIQTS